MRQSEGQLERTMSKVGVQGLNAVRQIKDEVCDDL